MKIVWERIWEKSFIWNILQVFKVIFEVNVYSIYLFLEFFKIGNRFFSLAPAFLPWDSQETLKHLRQPYGPGQWMPLCWRHMWWKDILPGGEPEAKQIRVVFLLWREVELETWRWWSNRLITTPEAIVISVVWDAWWSHVDIWVPCWAGLPLEGCHTLT